MNTDRPRRPWRTIANELQNETDPTKIIRLTQELDATVAAQRIIDTPKSPAPPPSGKGNS